MFGRRAKRVREDKRENVVNDTFEGATLTLEVATSATPTVDADSPAVTSPIRAAGSGHDAGLAAVEAEFTVSDGDLALLDLSAITFDQQASRLSMSEVILAEHRDELAAYMPRLNSSLSTKLGTPVDLQPYFMIPERCWEGENQQVLVEVLDLAPAQIWNVLPLAADASTEAAVGVARHPGARELDHRAIASTLIDEAVERMQRSLERATFATDAVDTLALDAARNQATADIKAIARRIAGMVIGPEAVDHTRALFFND